MGAYAIVRVQLVTQRLTLLSLSFPFHIQPHHHPPASFIPPQELGLTPYFALWLRYTGFIVLYPIGVASELTMIYLALPTIKKTHLWSVALPNKLNFGFDYHTACLLVMLTYLPGTPERSFASFSRLTWHSWSAEPHLLTPLPAGTACEITVAETWYG